MIKQIDAIELLKSLPDKSVDLIFTDPPYALGSEVIIREDGKPDYKKAVDFMNKWDQPDGKFWEEWFKEANRVLKYGGRVLMFGMDRQLMLNKYYACFSGLQEQQSLYWYFASSMPKATDLSKMLDKHFGEEREVIGKYKLPNGQDWNLKQAEDEDVEGSGGTFTSSNRRTLDITKGTHPLAQKYDGFKYSIAPLKQTQEVVSVFQKIPDIYWDNRILLAQNIKDILECIMTTTHSNDLENGMIASNAEINFISLQVEQLQTQRGNHIAQMSAEEIEKTFACTVEMASMLRQAKLENIAVLTVMENLCVDLKAQTIHNGLADDLRELMGMYLSEIPKTQSNGYLNIGQLWLNILVEIWIEMKMFTTSMKSEMIIELKTLNYYLTENIKHFTQQRILPNENSQKLFANSVIRNFTNVILKLQRLNEIFVQNHAGIVSCEMKQSPQNETIMVFLKPYKTGSAMHDVLAYENGDAECCCGALNIDGSRAGTGLDKEVPGYVQVKLKKGHSKIEDMEFKGNKIYGAYRINIQKAIDKCNVGRFPSQTFCDSETAKLLDEQSGEKTSGAMKRHHNVGKTDKDGMRPNHGKYGEMKATPFPKDVESSVGGCSKILHKCDYDEMDIELYYYCSKVNNKERNMGNIDNNHPTLKPISLLLKILNLFKTPNPQVCVDTFTGSGSIPIAAKLLGFEVIAGDLDEGFVEIANARLDYAIKNKTKLLHENKIIAFKNNFF